MCDIQQSTMQPDDETKESACVMQGSNQCKIIVHGVKVTFLSSAPRNVVHWSLLLSSDSQPEVMSTRESKRAFGGARGTG